MHNVVTYLLYYITSSSSFVTCSFLRSCNASNAIEPSCTHSYIHRYVLTWPGEFPKENPYLTSVSMEDTDEVWDQKAEYDDLLQCLVLIFLIFFIQAEPYIGITPGCAASESGVTSPELLIMFPYGNLERF